MELRHILLVVALLVTSVFVIPAVYSIFAGQHWFYEKGTSVCLKCHPDIRNELDSSMHHISFTCENCHVFNMSENQTHGNVVVPRCLDCHGIPPQTVIDSNGNLYLSPIAKVFGENISNNESHNPFVESAKGSLLMKGENEACVSCHTAKSLSLRMNFADTYRFNSERSSGGGWQLSNYLKNTEVGGEVLVQSSESTGNHLFKDTAQIKCEKCHSNMREELNSSSHHKFFACSSCHQLFSTFHSSSTPPCLDCHGKTPQIVTDQNGNTIMSPIASVYAGNPGGADAHIPLVTSSKTTAISEDSNIACSSCHSSFNNNISFTRPAFLEWDVVNSSGIWTIENLSFGPNKEVIITKYLDGKIHNISDVSEVNCISCHEDIKQAVDAGGHSNEQWKQKHTFTGYSEINSYCRSCHKPLTQNNIGTSPFPQYPFNSPVHGAMTISCMDCHSRSGSLFVDIDGMMQTPSYNSSDMGSVEISIEKQPAYIRSYLCIACKNTGNPVPNNSLHFKLYTEPLVIINVNGNQKYP